MSYCTLAQWQQTSGHLGPDEDDAARIEDRLDAASRYLDGLLGRAWPLETHTVTRRIALQGDRRVRLGDDRPTVHHDLWTVTVSACAIYDGDGALAETVTAGTVSTMFAASGGYLLLPPGAADEAGRLCQVTYTAGYAAVPDALREACVEVARSLQLRDLDQRDPLDLSVAGAAKARAREIAQAHALHAVA